MAENVEKWYPGSPTEKVSIGRMILLNSEHARHYFGLDTAIFRVGGGHQPQ